jgi:integrase
VRATESSPFWVALALPKGGRVIVGNILTDRAIKALKPAPKGKRYDVPDGRIPALRWRVNDKGVKTGVLTKRLPGKLHPTRLPVCVYDPVALPLQEGRAKALQWIELLNVGKDPRDIEKEARKAEEAKRFAADREAQAGFSTVLEIFIEEYASKLRTGDAIAVRLRNEAAGVWRDRSVHSIDPDVVRALIIKIKKRPAPENARSVLDGLRMMAHWLVEEVEPDKPYRMKVPFTIGIRPVKLIGSKAVGHRVFDDDELRALWAATEELGYPVGTMTRMLLYTGGRLREVSDAAYTEIKGDTWVIPPKRFKANVEHRVPITEDLRALLDELPRFKSGDYLFSCKFGRAPIRGFSDAKRQLDKLMPEGTERWSFHATRRTVRTRLSGLQIPTRDKKNTVPIPDHVAELVIGHGRKGIQRHYDLEKYAPEIRAALEAWQAKLRLILNPADNVVALSVAG